MARPQTKVSLLTELSVVLVLRTDGPFWRSRPGAALLWSTAAMTAIALGLPYSGSFAELFGFVPLSPGLLLAGIGITFAYVLAAESTKGFFYRGRRSDGTA